MHAEGRVRAGNGEFCLGGRGWLPGKVAQERAVRQEARWECGRRMFRADETSESC